MVTAEHATTEADRMLSDRLADALKELLINRTILEAAVLVENLNAMLAEQRAAAEPTRH
jgi:NifU-like protein involved in Fe-S cluster formation